MNNQFVLSVEGQAYTNRGDWTTHKILGVASRKVDLIPFVPSDLDDEDICIVTYPDGNTSRISAASDLNSKSSLVQQAANELGIGFVDLELAQIEATDLRGCPKEVDGRTVYCPPIELPQEASRSEGRK